MKTSAIAILVAMGTLLIGPDNANAACASGQQAYYTSSGGANPTAQEHCTWVSDQDGDVAWTGDINEHLTPVMVDHDNNPATPNQQLVIDGKPIVVADSSADNHGNHQHNDPFVKGINGVAVGDGAVVGHKDANGNWVYTNNGTAIGAGTQVTHHNSTAIGAGAKSTDTNQVTLGTKDETIRAEGITSQKSKDRQVGPTEVVTSDSGGRLATDGGAIFRQLGTHNDQISALEGLAAQHGATLNAHSALLSDHTARLDEQAKGIAISMAMPDAWLSDSKRFGIFGAVGGFGDETAIGAAVIGRIGDGFTLNGKLGSDTEFDQFGWQVGVGAQW